MFMDALFFLDHWLFPTQINMVLPSRPETSFSLDSFPTNSEIVAQIRAQFDKQMASYNCDNEAFLACLRSATSTASLPSTQSLNPASQPAIFPSKEAFCNWNNYPRPPIRVSPAASIQSVFFPSDNAFNNWQANCQLPDRLSLPPPDQKTPSLQRKETLVHEMSMLALPIWSNLCQPSGVSRK